VGIDGSVALAGALLRRWGFQFFLACILSFRPAGPCDANWCAGPRASRPETPGWTRACHCAQGLLPAAANGIVASLRGGSSGL